jgi:hypothetical protein
MSNIINGGLRAAQPTTVPNAAPKMPPPRAPACVLFIDSQPQHKISKPPSHSFLFMSIAPSGAGTMLIVRLPVKRSSPVFPVRGALYNAESGKRIRPYLLIGTQEARK